VCSTSRPIFTSRQRKPIAYIVRDERILIDDDGTITTRESAIPPNTRDT